MSGFAVGDSCLLIDRQGRRFLLKLSPEKMFSTHTGTIPHSAIIGAEDGQMFQSTGGSRYVAFRPRLSDFILKMKRGAQVVYPKDIGPILVHGDIAAGMTVVEAGTGSGALTLALARAVGATGRVVTVERRPDHEAIARATFEEWFGGTVPDHIEMRSGEVDEVIREVRPERVVLDVPEPWTVIETVGDCLPGGAVFTSYVPTVIQVQTTVNALRSSGVFSDVSAFEVLHRDWHVQGRSLRPAHEMVAHTGFIITARRYLRLNAEEERPGTADEEE